MTHPYELIDFSVGTFLPEKMYSQEATTMLLAIGYQESGFEDRHQVGGPARGFWQFEVAGVKGVLEHHATAKIAGELCSELGYELPTAPDIHAALEHNDILAACFARLLLWTLPQSLPDLGDGALAWDQYLDAWRPGKPRPEHWRENYNRAKEMLGG